MEFEYLGSIDGEDSEPPRPQPKRTAPAPKSGMEFEYIGDVAAIGEVVPEAGVAQGALDIGRKFLMGAFGGVRSLTNTLGANNPLSKSLAGIEDYIERGLSAQSRNDAKAIAQLFDEAESKGLGAKLAAGLEAFTISPAETLAQAGGYMLPNLAVGLLGKAAQLGKLGMTAAQAGTGAVMGTGIVKGEIYQGVTDYLREQGTPEDQIEPIATKAQAYGGKNLDQFLLAAGLGAADALLGAEKILTRLLTRTGKEVSKKTIGSLLKGGAVGGLAESAIEFPQEAQEQVAQNLALQRIGADVPTFKGAIQAGAMGAAAGFVLGGGAGAVEVMTAEDKAAADIDADARKAARELLAPEGDASTRAIVNEINATENAIAGLRQEYDQMDPATPEAQALAGRISENQNKLAGLKEQIGEPLALLEKKQAELAAKLVEPPKDEAAPPVSSTITPVVSEKGAQISDITPEPTISEKAETSTMIGAEPTQPAAAPAVTEVKDIRDKKEIATALPVEERATYDQADAAVKSIFGDNVPDNLIILDDDTREDYRMRAAYLPQTGSVVLNLAYIGKGENVQDIINHELGHYIYGDQDFRDTFQVFWESMSPEEKAYADNLISQFYNKETGEIQMEEKQVRAFMQLVQDAKAQSKWKRVIDAVKNWLNRIFGTNFQTTDRGALAVLAAGVKRFGSGERIIREGDQTPRRMAAEPREEGIERQDKRGQVGGVEGIGTEITTPKKINAKVEDIIRNNIFNAAEVSDANTNKAWNLIQNLQASNPNSTQLVDSFNALTNETLGDSVNEGVKQAIAAAKVRNELFAYAMKLTADGDLKMLQYLLNNDLQVIGTGGTLRTGAQALQASFSMKNWIIRASEAEKTGVFQVAAQQFFNTKNPTDEQIQQMKELFEAVDKVKIDQVKELSDELDKVGKATGIDVQGKVQEAINAATPKRDPWVVAIEILKKELGMPLAGFSIKPSDITDKIKAALKPKLANFRKKMTKEGATGLEKTFWKTMSDQEDKPGPLAEVDTAINRNLAAIVKDTLIKSGLKGEPPNTKLTVIEQVASILSNNTLTQERINALDAKITDEIDAREGAELNAAEEAGASADVIDEIEARYNGLREAWAIAMQRQLDIPISDATLRRMVIAESKEAGVDLNELAEIADTDPAVAKARKEKLAAAIVAKVANVEAATLKLREGVEGLRLMSFLPTNYMPLYEGLIGAIDSSISARNTKRKAANALKTAKDEAGDPNKQAKNQIKRLAKIQSDTQEWPTPKKDAVREIVSNDLQNTPDLGRKEAWKSMLVGKLKGAGVNETQAETLADLVWNQHEKNALTREMDALTTAVEKGPLKGIVDAILNTPLAEQQKPEWRQDVIRKYLADAGVPSSKADNIAKLFDLSLRKRFAEAQEKAADKSAKSLEGGITTTSKRAMDKLRKAIRAQVLDPGKDVAKAFSEQMGWKGFTKEQIVRLNELDAIVNDKNTTDAEISASIEKINRIIDQVSLPPKVKDIIGSYYVGNILGRFTTFTIQQIDPLFYTTFNAAIQSFQNITNPAQFIQVWKNYGLAITNLINETRFSFKNDVLRSGKILDYMERQDRQIGRLWNEAEKKWKAGDIKGAMKDGIFGYTAYTFRTLKALDDGAYSLLTTANLPMYVEAALKRANIPRAERRGVMRQILEARELDIKTMVDKGISRNDAVVYANERMRGDITRVLTGLNIDAQEVIDSALNDALSRIGKTRFSTDINGKETEVKDLGTISAPFLQFYENVARSVNAKGGSEAQKIFYRILFGFPLIPARIFNIAAGYTPLTIYRHALKKRYSLTYGTALQQRQRIIEQMAGTAVLLPLLFLRSASLDEEDEKKRGFGIYITGQGPSRMLDKETREQWDKRFDPYSLTIRVDGKSSSLDARAAGPLAVIIYTLGAVDDWQNRRIQEGKKTTKDDWRDVQEKSALFTALYDLSGSFILTTARRGPTTGLLQGLVDFRRYPDDPIAAIGADAAFSAMPAVPIIGTGIAKNLSDLFSQPIDNRTKEGAILANIPIVGPIVGQPALNAYGQRMGQLRVSEKLKKSFGLPFTLIADDSEEDTKLTSLTLKFGDGPTPITRRQVENEIKAVLTDEDWYATAKAFGDHNRKRVLAAYDRLDNMSPERFASVMSNYSSEAKKIAIREARRRSRMSR